MSQDHSPEIPLAWMMDKPIQEPSPTLTEAERKAAWLEDRRTCITGSEVATILGLSKYGSQVEIYLDKKGLLPGLEENDYLYWGKKLERPILEAYAERKQKPIEFADSYKLIRVPGFNLLGATLDARLLADDRHPVDAKNIGRASLEWGPDGSNIFPTYYQCQLQVQMMVTATPCAELAVLFGGHEFASYMMAFDAETAEIMMEKVSRWWEYHIIGDNPPEADASVSCSEYLKAKFAKGTLGVIPATPELRQWTMRRKEAKERMEAAEADKIKAENMLKNAMGMCTEIKGLCTWRNNKDSEQTKWEEVVRDIKNLYNVPPDVMLSIVQKYTVTKPGARVLRFS